MRNTRRKNIRKTKGRKNIKKYKGGSNTYKTIVDPNFNISEFLDTYEKKDFMKEPIPFYDYEQKNRHLYKNKDVATMYRKLLGGYYLSKCDASNSEKHHLLCEKFKAAVSAFASPPTESV